MTPEFKKKNIQLHYEICKFKKDSLYVILPKKDSFDSDYFRDLIIRIRKIQFVE